jgi:uncharacterized protein DUF397
VSLSPADFPAEHRRALWRKSSHSGAGSGDCVEVADNLPQIVAVRDSTAPRGPRLTFSRPEWRAFLVRTRQGAYDL